MHGGLWIADVTEEIALERVLDNAGKDDEVPWWDAGGEERRRCPDCDRAKRLEQRFQETGIANCRQLTSPYAPSSHAGSA